MTILTCYCHDCEWMIKVVQVTECEDVCPKCGSTKIGLSHFEVMQPQVSPDYQPRSHIIISGGDDE